MSHWDKLVQRHQLIGRIAGLDGRMTPAVPQRDAAEHDPRRPDRTEMLEQFRQDGGGRNTPVGRQMCQMIEQPAGPRLIVAGENR